MNFNKDLAFGNEAERWLLSQYPDLLALLDSGRNGDLVTKSGLILELKAERRTSTSTKNIFMEVLSNKVKKTPGGCWQAAINGCTYMAYLFWADKKLFVYDVKKLLAHFDTTQYDDYNVTVAGSRAIGYIVPRKAIAHTEVPISDLK